MDKLAAALPGLAEQWRAPPAEGRAALRATTPDHLPLAGRIDRNGRYLLSGLGSRGFLTAPLAAETVIAGIAGRPPPLARDLAAALDPRRFENRTRRDAGTD